MEYIKRRELGFQVLVFTERDSFEEYIKDNHIEILLLGETLSLKGLLEDKVKYLYILSELPIKAGDTDEKTIFKYQSADELLSQVFTSYTKKQNETVKIHASNERKIISLISIPPNRSKFCFTFSYAYLLSERRKVLFIPLDFLPLSFLSFMDDSNPALSEFIYYLKADNSNLISKMNQLIRCTDRVSYLTGLSHGLDLLSVTKEEMSGWIEEVKKQTDYDLIIFYLGSFAECTLETIRQSDEVLIIMSESSDDEAAVKELERQLNLIEITTETDKFVKIIIPNHEWKEDRKLSLQELKSMETWFSAKQYIGRL